jgi:hypothetical protein
MTEDKGLRFNEGKTRHDLTPAFAQEQYARVLSEGAKKYAPRNWEQGMAWSKVSASLERHLQAFKRGEDYDPETGVLHTAHIMCNAGFLTEYYKIYPQGDDRNQWWKNPVKRVWLDIDGVCANFEEHFLKYLKLPEDHPTDWYDIRFRDYFDLIRNDQDFWLSLQPIFDPAELDYPISGYCTARPVPNLITERWLGMNKFPKHELINVGEGGKKSEVLKPLCDVFVDDSIMNFWELQSAGVTCYLMTRPHNAKYNVGHWRVNDMKEFITKIK